MRSTLNLGRGADFLLWLQISVYSFARFVEIYPGKLPLPAVVALHVPPPILFAIVHGSRVYRQRGIMAFITITLLVANLSETFSLHTGFPFGHYHFTNRMGPKLA